MICGNCAREIRNMEQSICNTCEMRYRTFCGGVSFRFANVHEYPAKTLAEYEEDLRIACEETVRLRDSDDEIRKSDNAETVKLILHRINQLEGNAP